MRVELERCGRAMMAPCRMRKVGQESCAAAVAPDGLDDGDVWAAPLNVQGHYQDHSNREEETSWLYFGLWSRPQIWLFCSVFSNTHLYQRYL